MYEVLGKAATRVLRVLWMLEELGVDYQHFGYTPQSAEMLAVNPSGKVPALKVGDEIIIDSVAIIQFLADKHNKFTYPAGTIERAKQDSFTQFIVDELDATLWTAARHSFILPQDMRVPRVKDSLKWEFARSIGILEKRIGDNEFVMGGQMTVPDIVLTHCGGWARVAGFEIPDGPMRDYFRKMTKRPAYKRAVALCAK